MIFRHHYTDFWLLIYSTDQSCTVIMLIKCNKFNMFLEISAILTINLNYVSINNRNLYIYIYSSWKDNTLFIYEEYSSQVVKVLTRQCVCKMHKYMRKHELFIFLNSVEGMSWDRLTQTEQEHISKSWSTPQLLQKYLSILFLVISVMFLYLYCVNISL